MTVQKSFKRLVRARMAKTGERYTAARAQLLAGPTEGPSDPELAQLACSDARIRERTGRGWQEWFDLLDSWGAEALGHTEIARQVAEIQGADALAWNVQAVVASYERSRGKRAVGQRVGADGFVASASRTIAVDAEQVYAAFADPSLRAGWLPDLALAERTVTKPRSARFDVGDGPSRLFVTVEARGAARSTVVVEQSRLADNAEREARKAYWRAALATLKAELER
jgi:uncharacterized protein YndB with AHSA1/START domain